MPYLTIQINARLAELIVRYTRNTYNLTNKHIYVIKYSSKFCSLVCYILYPFLLKHVKPSAKFTESLPPTPDDLIWFCQLELVHVVCCGDGDAVYVATLWYFLYQHGLYSLCKFIVTMSILFTSAYLHICMYIVFMLCCTHIWFFKTHKQVNWQKEFKLHLTSNVM